MVLWQWSEKLKTDGDGFIDRHVKNMLYSRILVEEDVPLSVSESCRNRNGSNTSSVSCPLVDGETIQRT